jgi:hypothetical protein
MAKRTAPGPTLPDWQRSRSLRGLVTFRTRNGKPYATAWPKKRGKPKSATTSTQNGLFAATIRALKDVDPGQVVAAKAMSTGTAYTYRDVLFMAMHGEYIGVEGIAEMYISDQLDTLTSTPGAMLYRGPASWVGIGPPPVNSVLAFDPDLGVPYWVTTDWTGITELTGDITAGPGVGAQVATLVNTTVSPGTYDRASITVDSKGRILAASSNADDTGITELTGDLTAGPGAGSQLATLADTGVVAGSYGHASITVDSKGRIIDADVGAVATTSVAGTVIPDGTTITVDGTGVISAAGGGGGGGGLGTGVVRNSVPAAAFGWTGLSPALYYLCWSKLRPSANAKLCLQIGYGATPTYDGGLHHNNMNIYARTGTNTPFAVTNFSTSTFFLMDINQTASTTYAGGGVFIDISNADWIRAWGSSDWEGSDGNSHGMNVHGINYAPPSQPTAIQIFYDASANIAAGKATLWQFG